MLRYLKDILKIKKQGHFLTEVSIFVFYSAVGEK